MKKLIATLLILIAVLCLSAAGAEGGTEPEPDPAPVQEERPKVILYSVLKEKAEDGTIRAEYIQDGGAPQAPCRTVVWENGIRIQDEITGTSDLAAVLFREDGRYCGILCTERLCDSMLFRMMLTCSSVAPRSTKSVSLAPLTGE